MKMRPFCIPYRRLESDARDFVYKTDVYHLSDDFFFRFVVEKKVANICKKISNDIHTGKKEEKWKEKKCVESAYYKVKEKIDWIVNVRVLKKMLTWVVC